MRITELTSLTAKRRYMPLLLESDPSEEMIMRYLPRSRMFLLERDDPLQGEKVPEDEALGVAVVVDLGTGKCELKNLCIVAGARGQGYGRALVEHAVDAFSEECIEMLAGACGGAVPFYEQCGFVFSHVASGYFSDNYDHPVWKGGKRCDDLVYLRRMLRPSPLLSLYCMHQNNFYERRFHTAQGAARRAGRYTPPALASYLRRR